MPVTVLQVMLLAFKSASSFFRSSFHHVFVWFHINKLSNAAAGVTLFRVLMCVAARE